ncbi:MAG: cation:proton antiporter [Victivallales bacterium]|nr:cation:proton antiporter [Victivallales bacterium]
MIVNLALIFLLSLLLNWGFEKMLLPGLLGMLLTGMIMGPYGLDWMSPKLMALSGELRTAALIVILIRAGLGINRQMLNRVGKPALRMSCIPAACEGACLIPAAHWLLGLPWLEAGMLGFIIAAVSPAVVVPQMLELKERRLGADKEVPTLLLAGASADNVFAITVFYVFLNLGTGQRHDVVWQLVKAPLSVVIGIVVGLALGWWLVRFFRRVHIRDTKKVLIFFLVAILFHHLEVLKWPVASLLGIMAMGFVILEKYEDLAHRLAAKFGKVWVFAEILLFVLVGAQFDVHAALQAGLAGVILIAVGLVGRCVGVAWALMNSELNRRERWFCVFAYLPKATVQAAVGAVPLAAGVASGSVILAVAVLAIVITAPVGSLLIRFTAPRLLAKG